MPQLDRFTFVSQVLWLLIVFIGLYLILLKTGLPRLYKVLSFRKKKLESIREEVIGFEKELYLLDKGVKSLVLIFIKTLKVLPDQLGKIIDQNIDRKLVLIKRNYNIEREYMYLNKSDKKIQRDLNIAEVLDTSSLIKDKGSLKKKILN